MLPLVAAFGVLVVLLGIYLARVPAYNAEDFIALQKSSFAPFLKDLAFRWHAAEVMLDFVLITVCYYLAYRLRFEGEGFDNFLPYFTASLPVVLGCKLAALYGSGLYQRSWDTFGLRDLAAVVRGCRHGFAPLGADRRVPLSLRGVFPRGLPPRRAAAGHRHRRDARVVPDDESRGGRRGTSAAAACWSTAPASSARRWSARCARTRDGT